MSKNIKLSAVQKDEIRRLTQLANRRIRNAEKAYKKEGLTVLPSEIVGDYQIKEKWATTTTPISRSVKFESKQAYKKQLKFLKSFENYRPGIREYTDIQKVKIIQAVETSIGADAPDRLKLKLGKMTAPQLAKFWVTYSNKSAKLGLKYSSNAAMIGTLEDVFKEDLTQLMG